MSRLARRLISGNIAAKPVEATTPGLNPPLDAFHVKPNRLLNNAPGVPATPRPLTPADVGPTSH